jgi:hypothetical protein
MTAFPQNQRTLRSILPVLFRPQTNAITTNSFNPRPSDTVFHARLHHHSASVHELTPLLPRQPFIEREDSTNCQRCGIPSEDVSTSKLLWSNPAHKNAPAVQFNQKRRLIAAGRPQTVYFVTQTNFVIARLSIPAPAPAPAPTPAPAPAPAFVA